METRLREIQLRFEREKTRHRIAMEKIQTDLEWFEKHKHKEKEE